MTRQQQAKIKRLNKVIDDKNSELKKLRKNKEKLKKEIKEILTDGWTSYERKHWKDYLEEEVKPYYLRLYKLLSQNQRKAK